MTVAAIAGRNAIGRRTAGAALVVAALLAAGAGSAQAIDLMRLAAADRLLDVVERQGGRVAAATSPPFDMADCMGKALDAPGGIDCPRRERDYDAAIAAIAGQRPRITAEVRAAMRQRYAAEFSAAELDAIAAFYATPTGGHLLVERPSLDEQLHAAEARAFLSALAAIAPEVHHDR